jgi:hypothetical protein
MKRIIFPGQTRLDRFIEGLSKIIRWPFTRKNEPNVPGCDDSTTSRQGPAVCHTCGKSDKVVMRGKRITKTRGKVARFYCKRCGQRFIETPFARTRYPDWVIDHVLGSITEGLPLTRIARDVKARAKDKKIEIAISRKGIINIVQRSLRILLDFESSVNHASLFINWLIDDSPQPYSGKNHIVEHKDDRGNLRVQAKPKKDWYFAWITNIMDEESRYWLAGIVSEGRSYKESEKAARAALRITKRAPILVISDGYGGHWKGIRQVFRHVKMISVSKDVDPAIINLLERLNGIMRSLAVKKRRKYRLLVTLYYSVELSRIYYNFLHIHSRFKTTPARKTGVEYPFHEGFQWSELLEFAFEYLKKQRPQGITESVQPYAKEIDHNTKPKDSKKKKEKEERNGNTGEDS